MDGSELVFILMPIVIPLFLAIGIAAPYIADSRANKRRRVYKKGQPDAEQSAWLQQVTGGGDDR